MVEYQNKYKLLESYQKYKDYLEGYSVIGSVMTKERIAGLRRLWASDYAQVK